MHGNQKGFHLLELAIVIIIVGLIGAVAYMFINKSGGDGQKTTVRTSDGATKDIVRWRYDHENLKWLANGSTPPACKNPLVFDQSPISLEHVSTIMMPGAYRGFNYKPHGGFRLSDDTNGNTEVRMPIDATLVGITRYYESIQGSPAELQYLLTFETDCGLAFRFDHLYTLTPEFQAFADKTPEPKLNDTRSSPDDAPDPVAFKAGEVIATKVGLQKTRNYGFDFGVYNYGKRNDISQNSTWAKIHKSTSSFDYHGICWLGMLPGEDSKKATRLSEIAANTQKPNLIVSDYCKNARHTTLDFNSGQPTDG